MHGAQQKALIAVIRSFSSIRNRFLRPMQKQMYSNTKITVSWKPKNDPMPKKRAHRVADWEVISTNTAVNGAAEIMAR